MTPFFFFLLFHRFRNLFFFFFFSPIFSNAIATIANFFFIPLFRQWHCHNWVLTIFFSPYFGNAIATITLPQFFFLPISAMALPQLVCQIFFSFHFEHSMHTGSRIGHRKFGIPVAEIQ